MMTSKVINIAGRPIRFYLAPTLAYLCLMPLLLALANWQFERAEQKQQLLDKAAQNAVAEIMQLSDLAKIDMQILRYKQIQLTGRYDQQHQFLLDNQISAGKAGYFVITPFWPQDDNRVILINRGWLPLNQDRTILPELSIDEKPTVITGRINQFPSIGLKLPGVEIATDTWPSVMQLIDNEKISKKLTLQVMPFQVELNKDQPYGFKRDWQITTVMQPEQHIAYAVQWLLLALTLTVLFIWYSFRNENDGPTEKK